jgi:hypothetical protein
MATRTFRFPTHQGQESPLSASRSCLIGYYQKQEEAEEQEATEEDLLKADSVG